MSIKLTASPTGATESKNFLSGIEVQTSPTFVEESDYEELIPEDSFNIKAGVFFDGTLNSRANINSRLEDEKRREGKRYNQQTARLYIENIPSFENDHSNISRMEPAYEPFNSEKTKQISLYVEGIGTENYEADDGDGYKYGTGSTGVKQKVLKACEELVKLIKDVGVTKIDTLTIDVFGFSRGAAAARNFISEVSKNQGQIKEIIGGRVQRIIKHEQSHGALGEHLSSQGITTRSLVVRFAGLYDTVASYGVRHSNDTRELDLTAVKKSLNALQLAAADEHRVNFILTNIDSAKGRGVEKFLPGVHSDIGGGYLDDWDENVTVDWDTSLVDLREARQLLIDQGYFSSNELVIDDFWGTLKGTKTGLSNRYSFIPMHIMSQYSINKNVGLAMARITSSYPIPSILLPVKTRLYKYV